MDDFPEDLYAKFLERLKTDLTVQVNCEGTRVEVALFLGGDPIWSDSGYVIVDLPDSYH